MKNKLNDLKLLIILIFEIALIFIFGDMILPEITGFFYAISLTLKGILLMLLPFIIFVFLMHSMCQLRSGAIGFVILAFVMVVCSNFISTSLSGMLGEWGLNHIQQVAFVKANIVEIQAQWVFEFPKFLSNEIALFLGLFLGIVISFLQNQKLLRAVDVGHKIVIGFFQKYFIPLIPLFVLGFLMKMSHDGILELIIRDYLPILLMICCFVLTYIILLYGIVAKFNLRVWFRSIKNMFPAMITGFSAMSSASALPLIIEGVRQNTKHHYGSSVAPITVNIHLIGDCFALPIFAFGIMISFGMPLPPIEQYLLFTVFFVLAKFAVAAVPGGGVFVMLPILEKYLGFNGEMLSLITALYILFDPIVTACNVLGNGAFAMHFSKIYQLLCRLND